MNHEAYENQMIDAVNRNADEKQAGTQDGETTAKKSVFTKTDAMALRRGLKRTVIALLTVVLFALSVFDFIATATATGYWAVVLFISAIVLMMWAVTLLYAQGIIRTESRGDRK